MICHPLLLAVLVMDFLSFFLLLASAWAAFGMLLSWSPGVASREQLRLEIRAEAASIQTRYALTVFCASTLILTIGVAHVLPLMVPGAMCGTGVLQATKGMGSRALAFRFLAVAALYLWYIMDRLDRTQPDAPLATATARALLFVTPLLFMAFTDTARAVMALDVHQPIDCCAVVYDQVRTISEGSSVVRIPDRFWLWSLAFWSTLLLAAALGVWMSESRSLKKRALVLAICALVWMPSAYLSLVKILAAYHYGVLQHQCPWCLFLPEHNLVGFPLFGALGLVGLEGIACLAAASTAETASQIAPIAVKRSRTAGLRVLKATILFLALAGLPAIIWKVRFGVWMD
jgi:hypothetical protein